MTGDIRSFFGGSASGPAASVGRGNSNGAKSSKKPRARKVISDDSDDDNITEKEPGQTASGKVKKEQLKVEETTSSEYFASAGKTRPVRETPIRSKTTRAYGNVVKTPTKATNGSAPSTGRRSTRKTTHRTYAEDDEDAAPASKDDLGVHDDIHTDDFQVTGRNGEDDCEEASEDEPATPKAKTTKPPSRKHVNGMTKKTEPEDDDGDIEMAEITAYDGGADSKRNSASNATAGRKRKSRALNNDEEDFLDDRVDDGPRKKVPKTSTAKPRVNTKKESKEESREMQALFDSIPTVRAPTPPLRDENKKFQYKGGNNAAEAMAPGSKEIPSGEDNCLAGLTFVFTGVLESLGREEGQSLVKRYGGKVTTSPSSRTSYVVLGSDAGPKKLETIQKLGIKTINEDGLFELIKRLPANGGDGQAAEKHAEKKAKEEEKIRKEAAEMEKKEKEVAKEAAKAQKTAVARAGGTSSAVISQAKKPHPSSRLWVDKYAPDALTSVCGNKGQVESLQNWLRNWHRNAQFNFKKAGADGKGIYRAAMLHGPPGVGKTTAAHLVARLEGFDVVESNASDTRSKKLVESGLQGVLDTTSLLGYFAADGQKVSTAKKKLVLIMDEVDGMSAGDRGGVGALAAVAKKTSIPMILICNERRLPKMKPFDFVTADFSFRRPTVDQIRARMMTICYREGLKIPSQVIDALIEGSHADIRQVINMISTAKLDHETMDFGDGKAMSKAWEKHVILKPWDIVGKILRPQMFAVSSTATLNDKIELYFNDHEFSSLMLQENYLKTTPTLANDYEGKERNLKLLELSERAAMAISDGDLVDRMIHGTQQQWSLMPAHAVFSFVRPASYMYGNFSARAEFAGWLGQNSKYGKLTRFIKEIQGHMRLRASGDRHEVRQQYLPALWNNTVRTLRDSGKEAVPEVIDFMDSYFLTRDDFDSMLELGVGPMDMEGVKIDTQTKATFTRTYNSQSHPMPFMKASSVGNVIGGKGKKIKADLEEAIEESDEEQGAASAEGAEVQDDEDEELDLKKDKYIKAPKKKTAAKAKTAGAKGKGRGKKGKDEDDEDDAADVIDDDAEDVKPKKKTAASRGGRGGGRGRGKH